MTTMDSDRGLLRPLRRRHQRRPVPDVRAGSATRRRSTTTSATTSGRCRATPTSRRRCVNWQDVLQHPQRHPRHHQGRHRAAAGRDPVRGPAGAHDAPRPHVTGLHPAAHGGARGPGARSSASRCLDPLVGSDGFDIIAELGADACRCGSSACCSASPSRTRSRSATRPTPTCAPCPGKPMEVKQEDVASGDMFADYIEWRAEHPSDDLMTQLLNAEFEDEHGETRNADPPGGPHLHRGPRRRRQRDHRPAHRLAGQGARRAPRPATGGRRGPLAHPAR